MKKLILTFATVSTILSQSASGAIDITIDNISDFNYFEDELRSEATSWSSTSLTSDTGFTEDYSTQGETTLTVNFQFPAGQQLVVATPSNFDFLDIDFDCRFDDGMGDLLSNYSPDVTVEGNAAAEALSANAQTHFYTDGDPDLRSLVSFSLAPGETYIFNSITITTTVPAEYDVAFNNEFADVSEVEFTAVDSSGTASDPGNWGSLQPIPEPSAYTLVVAVYALGLAIIRRQR
jgi:hypothetical protein